MFLFPLPESVRGCCSRLASSVLEIGDWGLVLGMMIDGLRMWGFIG